MLSHCFEPRLVSCSAQRQAPPVQATTAPPACDSSTKAPATTTPRGSYLPDGSSPNTLYPNISREGTFI